MRAADYDGGGKRGGSRGGAEATTAAREENEENEAVDSSVDAAIAMARLGSTTTRKAAGAPERYVPR